MRINLKKSKLRNKGIKIYLYYYATWLTVGNIRYTGHAFALFSSIVTYEQIKAGKTRSYSSARDDPTPLFYLPLSPNGLWCAQSSLEYVPRRVAMSLAAEIILSINLVERAAIERVSKHHTATLHAARCTYIRVRRCYAGNW